MRAVRVRARAIGGDGAFRFLDDVRWSVGLNVFGGVGRVRGVRVLSGIAIWPRVRSILAVQSVVVGVELGVRLVGIRALA